jgi:hypothetical protein
MQGRSDIRQFVLTILGAAAGIVLLLGFFLLAYNAQSLGGATAASPFGWTVPLASLFVIVGVTWLLLSQTPKDPGTGPWLYAPCPSCGRSVMRDWRLCPYCGEVLERQESEQATGSG